jgi:preprotein translocase subunit SecD
MTVAMLAGCSSAKKLPQASPTPTHKPTPPLEVRHVTGEKATPCSEPPLTAKGAGAACDLVGAIRYELGPLAGRLTIKLATEGTEFDGVNTGQHLVIVQLDKAGTATFATLSSQSVGKPLAFLVNGRVVMAPVIGSPIKDGRIALAPDPKVLKQVETTLNAH